MTSDARNSRRIWVLFGLIVALFLSFAAVQEHQQNAQSARAKQMAEQAYNDCVARDLNAARLNATFEALAALEEADNSSDDPAHASRVRTLNAARFTIVDCGVHP